MKIISHRGNLSGVCDEENKPRQIEKALDSGFDCEIDLWYIAGKLMLGHDAPLYEIDFSFISKPGLWVHAKNIEVLNYLNETNINYFFHNNDKATLTSHRYIWCYPGVYCERGITVLTGREQMFNKEVYGICTDYPLDFI